MGLAAMAGPNDLSIKDILSKMNSSMPWLSDDKEDKKERGRLLTEPAFVFLWSSVYFITTLILRVPTLMMAMEPGCREVLRVAVPPRLTVEPAWMPAEV